MPRRVKKQRSVRTRKRPVRRAYRFKRRMKFRRRPGRAASRAILHRAYQLGKTAAKEMAIKQPLGEFQLKDMNNRWNHWFNIHQYNKLPWRRYIELCQSFFSGVSSESKIAAEDYLLLPTDKTVSVVVNAMNEEHTIAMVLKQLKRLPFHEVIIVINGTHDATYEIVRNNSKAIVLHFNEPLGHDVGRALGAKISRSDILLFLDGDIPINAEQLLPFIGAVDSGLDVALNRITPYLQNFSKRDGVTIVKQLLNRVLGRADLGADSLTAIPHALSRKAIETIGHVNLVVPPKAQAIAIKKGLSVGAPAGVNVVTNNRLRKTNIGVQNPVSDLIVGDHIEALHYIAAQEGVRMAYPDEIRKRSYLTEVSEV